MPGDETIRLIMRELGLVACQPRRWRPTPTIAGDGASTRTCSSPADRLSNPISGYRYLEAQRHQEIEITHEPEGPPHGRRHHPHQGRPPEA